MIYLFVCLHFGIKWWWNNNGGMSCEAWWVEAWKLEARDIIIEKWSDRGKGDKPPLIAS